MPAAMREEADSVGEPWHREPGARWLSCTVSQQIAFAGEGGAVETLEQAIEHWLQHYGPLPDQPPEAVRETLVALYKQESMQMLGIMPLLPTPRPPCRDTIA
jgi:hypothetical protein